ncbi:MAG: ATP-binding protein [Rhodanobacter sp.]
MFRSFYKLYLMLSISVLIAALVLVPSMERLFVARTSIGTHTGKDDAMRSTAYELRDWLMSLPETQWRAALRRIRPPFPLTNFTIVPRSQVQLSAAQQVVLDRGLLIADQQPGNLVLALPPSDLVLQVKQQPDMPAAAVFQVIAWSLVCLLLFGSVFLWLSGHWRDLEQLSRAADRFGNGDLAARSALSAHSSVAPLAHRFDGMAARIETLATTQNDMINAVSHELRTPITRFGFGLALLRATDSEAERQRYAAALAADVTELEELVSELLSYGALAQVGRAPERYLTDLDELIGGVLGSVALEMEVLGVECVVDIQAGAERAILDPRLSARVLINLVKNAMRYCHGHMAIQVQLQHDRIAILVDDDGIGIPLAERKTIFEPFHRLDRSRDRKTGGSGLGLAIAKRAAVAQGGKLHALASPIGGARFEFLLPKQGNGSAVMPS